MSPHAFFTSSSVKVVAFWDCSIVGCLWGEVGETEMGVCIQSQRTLNIKIFSYNPGKPSEVLRQGRYLSFKKK
jgi:hypothetical protein